MDQMIVDNAANLLSVKATWGGRTIRFDLLAKSYQELLNELTKRCPPGFNLVQYVDDEGDAIAMSSDEELAQAIKYKTGSALKLVLAGPESPATRRKQNVRKSFHSVDDRMKTWLQRQEPEKHAQYEPLLQSLSAMGYPKFRANLKILRNQGGDLTKTIEILNARQVKLEERLKNREIKKLQKGQKRKRGADKHETKKRCKKGRCNRDNNSEDVAVPSFEQPSVAIASNTSQVVVPPNNFFDLAAGFPVGKFTHLFVDGNNMFYLTDKLRHFTLRGKTRITERVLSSVARLFAELVRLNVEIVFDAACSIPENSESTDSTPLVHLDNGSSFVISSARPSFSTSDAKFLAWARAHPQDAPKTLVITSDRALSAELQTLGVSVAKPGMWLTCVAQTAAGNPSENDWRAWLNAWIDKVGDQDAE